MAEAGNNVEENGEEEVGSIVQLLDDSDSEDVVPSTAAKVTDGAETPKETDVEAVPRSIKCDTCGKLFADEQAALVHAELRDHSSFSQSTEEVPKLTEEEKKKQVELVRQKIAESKTKKEEKEKKEAYEKEKRRRADGKNVAQMVEERKDAELKRAAEEQKRARRELEMEKRRILELIRLEKEEKKREAQSHHSQPLPQPLKLEPTLTTTSASSDVCRIQVRLPNGSVMKGEFKSNETLAAVKLWVVLNRTDGEEHRFPFTLMCPFPRKVFDEDDMMTPLCVLGLLPSASLVVTRAVE